MSVEAPQPVVPSLQDSFDYLWNLSPDDSTAWQHGEYKIVLDRTASGPGADGQREPILTIKALDQKGAIVESFTMARNILLGLRYSLKEPVLGINNSLQGEFTDEKIAQSVVDFARINIVEPAESAYMLGQED